MKLENLISMREYVLHLRLLGKGTTVSFFCIFKYADFLSQKLEIWKFVASKLVDGVWVVLEEPTSESEKYKMIFGEEKENILDLYSFDNDVKEYQQAKERCLFEGDFTEYDLKEIFKNKTIEDLVKYNLKLTATAQKQL